MRGVRCFSRGVLGGCLDGCDEMAFVGGVERIVLPLFVSYGANLELGVFFAGLVGMCHMLPFILGTSFYFGFLLYSLLS